jgi:alkanesulfonate monooxygenase SsuD/methylene tetrahydromethanopterin reductase-like flavin-dependent oxidoreductase (luciferase family)
MDESLALLRRLLAGESVTHRGEFFAVESTAVLPAPSKPIPLVIGGRSDAAVRRAGQLGDGWLGIWVSPERFATATAMTVDAAERSGRHGVRWHHGMTVWCGFGQGRSDGERVVASAMESLYGLPFAKFDRYVPRGTPQDVAIALRPYVEAGCTTFNLLAQCRDPSEMGAAVGEVRRLLNAGNR